MAHGFSSLNLCNSIQTTLGLSCLALITGIFCYIFSLFVRDGGDVADCDLVDHQDGFYSRCTCSVNNLYYVLSIVGLSSLLCWVSRDRLSEIEGSRFLVCERHESVTCFPIGVSLLSRDRIHVIGDNANTTLVARQTPV